MDLKAIAAETLKEVLDTVKESKKFVIEQAPELAKEIILEAKVSCLYNFLIALVFLIPCYIFFFSTLSAISSDTARTSGIQLFTLIASGIVGLISTFGVLCTIEEFISVTTAPKMYILKKISKAINAKD